MPVNNQDLDSIDERCVRVLDGMSVNFDKLARDAQKATQELRNWRAAFERMKAESANKAGFAGAFDELFKGFH